MSETSPIIRSNRWKRLTENYDSDVIIPATPPKKANSRRALQLSTGKNVSGEGKDKQELDKDLEKIEKEIDFWKQR